MSTALKVFYAFLTTTVHRQVTPLFKQVPEMLCGRREDTGALPLI